MYLLRLMLLWLGLNCAFATAEERREVYNSGISQPVQGNFLQYQQHSGNRNIASYPQQDAQLRQNAVPMYWRPPQQPPTAAQPTQLQNLEFQPDYNTASADITNEAVQPQNDNNFGANYDRQSSPASGSQIVYVPVFQARQAAAAQNAAGTEDPYAQFYYAVNKGREFVQNIQNGPLQTDFNGQAQGQQYAQQLQQPHFNQLQQQNQPQQPQQQQQLVYQHQQLAQHYQQQFQAQQQQLLSQQPQQQTQQQQQQVQPQQPQYTQQAYQQQPQQYQQQQQPQEYQQQQYQQQQYQPLQYQPLQYQPLQPQQYNQQQQQQPKHTHSSNLANTGPHTFPITASNASTLSQQTTNTNSSSPPTYPLFTSLIHSTIATPQLQPQRLSFHARSIQPAQPQSYVFNHLETPFKPSPFLGYTREQQPVQPSYNQPVPVRASSEPKQLFYRPPISMVEYYQRYIKPIHEKQHDQQQNSPVPDGSALPLFYMSPNNAYDLFRTKQ